MSLNLWNRIAGNIGDEGRHGSNSQTQPLLDGIPAYFMNAGRMNEIDVSRKMIAINKARGFFMRFRNLLIICLSSG